MKETIIRIEKFNNERDWAQFHTPDNLAKSIAIEAGELLECFQWSSDYNIEKVTDELADIFLYATILASKLNLDIDEIVNAKISRNENRYPVTKSKGNSIKYTEFVDEDNSESI